MVRLKLASVLYELVVVVRKRADDLCDRGGACFDEQRRAVGGRHGEEKEVPGTGPVENFNLS